MSEASVPRLEKPRLASSSKRLCRPSRRARSAAVSLMPPAMFLLLGLTPMLLLLLLLLPPGCCCCCCRCGFFFLSRFPRDTVPEETLALIMYFDL